MVIAKESPLIDAGHDCMFTSLGLLFLVDTKSFFFHFGFFFLLKTMRFRSSSSLVVMMAVEICVSMYIQDFVISSFCRCTLLAACPLSVGLEWKCDDFLSCSHETFDASPPFTISCST